MLHDREHPATSRPQAKRTQSGMHAVPCAARVLVVDEKPEWAHFVAHALRRHGHAAVVADSVERAVFLASLQKFDLLVTSLALSDGSGLTLFKRLLEANPGARGIAMSDGAVNEGVVLEAGFEYYLRKPVPIAAIMRAVRVLTPRISAERPSAARVG